MARGSASGEVLSYRRVVATRARILSRTVYLPEAEP